MKIRNFVGKMLSIFVLLAAMIVAPPPGICLESQPLDRFEREVQQLELKDKASPSAPGGTIFIGSSTFARWKTLEQDLSDLHALNRGFGGSTIPEATFYAKRLVASSHPARVVLYAGTNDIADGHSGKQVCDDFFKFVKVVRADLPGADIYFISMSVAPVRLSLQKEFDAGNDCIERGVKGDSKLHFIDVRPVMRDRHSQLKAEFFGPDHLHMTEAGYKAWAPVIRNALAE